MGGTIRKGNPARIIVSMMLTLLCAFSALSFSGLVAAGGHSHNPGVTGACAFNLATYAPGDTMLVDYSGILGAGDGSAYFQCWLKNPSGVIVAETPIDGADRTQGTLVYTLTATDQAGTWTAQMMYESGNRRAHFTVLGEDTAEVSGPVVDRLTLVQSSYDSATGVWEGIATLLDSAGAPMAGATVVLQYSVDGVSWRNTRQGSRTTDDAGHALMYTTGLPGLMLRVTYTADNLASNVVYITK